MRRLLLLLTALGLVFMGWVALTTVSTGSAIATWAPCPRNWGWRDSFLPRQSPSESTTFSLGGTHIKVCYGSPALRGRTMLGGDAVPFGQLWRTGANEPTTLHTDHVVRVGDLVLAAGSYSIYTIPGERSWTVILNRSTRQWGLESEYDDEVASHEIGRLLVRPGRLSTPVERLTIRGEPSATAAVDLVLEWQRTQIRLPIDSGFAAPEEEESLGNPGPD
jgi:hypothetical protein